MMKNGYDHHDHQGIYTYNLSVPKRFTLDVPIKSPPNRGSAAPRTNRLRQSLEVANP